MRDFKEYWFPGSHGDVGGGYPFDSGFAWRVPFEWMVGEARIAGLIVDEERLSMVLSEANPSGPHWLEAIHCQLELQPAWWIVEYLPRILSLSGLRRWRIVLARGRPRILRQGDMIHQSALQRIRESAYRPLNMSPKFIAYVQSLNDVPEALSYMEDPEAYVA